MKGPAPTAPIALGEYSREAVRSRGQVSAPPPLTTPADMTPADNAVSAAPGAALELAPLQISPRAWIWLKKHPATPEEIAAALLEHAARADWPAAEILEAPWARELAAFIAARLDLVPIGTLTSKALLTAVRENLAGKVAWPGDRAIQSAAPHLILALMGVRRRNDICDCGRSATGWRGLKLTAAPAAPRDQSVL
jgi:hypothetical protein